MNIDLLLSKNQFAVQELLRQNHILYSDIKQGIKLGYERHGESFAIKLINILSKDQNLSNSSDNTMGPEAPQGSWVDDNGVTHVPGADGGSGNFWNIWGNLLGYVGQTGSTYNQFMKDISGTSSPEQSQYNYEGSKLTWLYWAGGLLLLIILLILIFKK